jgi:hypothetical protein
MKLEGPLMFSVSQDNFVFWMMARFFPVTSLHMDRSVRFSHRENLYRE